MKKNNEEDRRKNRMSLRKLTKRGRRSRRRVIRRGGKGK